jgi:alpha-tubulin suppressor-like RCC1 family protein
VQRSASRVAACPALSYAALLRSQDRLRPTIVESLRGTRVVAASAGGYHCLCATETAVFSFGLGRAPPRDRTPVALLARGPCPRPAACSSKGRAFDSRPRSGCGALGHGGVDDCAVPTEIASLRGTRIVGLAAGWVTSIVLTDAGAVLSFGLGGCGALGQGDLEDRMKPTVIEALRGEETVALAVGNSHCLCVLRDGRVCGWGDGSDACLGLRLSQDQLTPLEYPQLRVAAAT